MKNLKMAGQFATLSAIFFGIAMGIDHLFPGVPVGNSIEAPPCEAFLLFALFGIILAIATFCFLVAASICGIGNCIGQNKFQERTSLARRRSE